MYLDMPAIPGVRLATAAAGIRYAERTDVLLALFEPGTTVAGVFTRSKCPSAPVEWCRARLKTAKPARTRGQFRQRQCLHRQERDAMPAGSRAQIAARAAGCKPDDVFLASTGVIGEPLKAASLRMVSWRVCVARAQADDFFRLRRAIMTTDTIPEGGDGDG